MARLIHPTCGGEMEHNPRIGPNTGYCWRCTQECEGNWQGDGPVPVPTMGVGAYGGQNQSGQHSSGGVGQLASSGQPAFQPNSASVGGKVASIKPRIVAQNLASLHKQGVPDVEYLPFLDCDGYIIKGWVTLLAAGCKVGKTELLARLAKSWTSERVCILSEEAEFLWLERARLLSGDWTHVDIAGCPGAGPDAVQEFIMANEYTVTIVDTMRGVLNMADENDNSLLVRCLTPIIQAARARRVTLLLSHHLRKAPGENGLAIAGGGGLVGVVDRFLEVTYADSGQASKRRKVTGRGRLFPVEDCIYELQDDLSFKILGSPKAVTLEAVKQRVKEVLSREKETLATIHARVGDPKPSDEQVRRALDALVSEGEAERDPKERKAGATYRYGLVRLHLQPPLSLVQPEVGVSRHAVHRTEAPLAAFARGK